VDRSAQLALTLLFVSMVCFFASMALFPLATRTPCGNRGVGWALTVSQSLAFLFVASRRTWSDDARKTMRIGASTFFAVGLSLNVLFLYYSHWLCGRMPD
jgi:hypothetical protein